MKKLFLLFFAISLFFTLQAQYRLVENYVPKDLLENGQPNIIKIPFSKISFDNGLTLIVSEDHSNPLVNINVTYKIGSSNDDANRTGMAYMLFKLMDKGSKHVYNGEYQSLIKQYGGKPFSQITRDKTSFSVTIPKNLLATVLWLESDRQAYLLDSLTQAKFDITKQAIVAELKDRMNQHNYGFSDILAQKNLYISGHPYTWSEFGMMEHYPTFSLNDLKKFFLDWYGTNNTIITVTGDVLTQDVVDLVNNYFGTLTKATLSQNNIDDLFSGFPANKGIDLNKPRFISYKTDVPNPMLKIVITTLPKSDKYEKTLNTIAYLLGQGNNSVLYNELVKKGLALSVNAQHKTYKYSGEFTIDIIANSGVSLSEIFAKVTSILNDISLKRNITAYIHDMVNSSSIIQIVTPPQDNSVTASDNKPTKQISNSEIQAINETKSSEIILKTAILLRTNELNCLENLQNRSMSLSDLEIITGRPKDVSPSLTEYNDITASSFYYVFDKYLMKVSKLIVSYVPKGMDNLIAAADNITESDQKANLAPSTQNFVYRYPATEINKKKPNIDDLAFNPTIAIITDKAPNGMIVQLVQDNTFSNIGFTIRMDASVVMKLLPNLDVPVLLATKYTEWFKNQGFDNPLKTASLTGSKVEFIPYGQFVDIHITCPKEQISIIKESILRFLNRSEYSINALYPTFIYNYNDTSALKEFRKPDLANVIKSLSGNLTINQNLDVEKKGLATAFYNMYNSKYMSAFTYGNNEDGSYNDYINRLSNWQTPGYFSGEYEGALLNPDTINSKQFKVQSNGNIFLLPDDNKESAMIVVDYMQLPIEVSDNYYTGKLANFVFGMSSENYLSKKLANRSYIHKIKAINYYKNNKEYFAVVLNVKPDKLYDAYNDLMTELNNFSTFKPEKNSYNSVVNEFLYKDFSNYETFSQKESFINNLIMNKIPSEIITNQNTKTKDISASTLAKFWKSTYKPENSYIVFIGNEAQLQNSLSKTGKKIIKIDKSGTIQN